MMENYYGVFTNQSAVTRLAEVQQYTVDESSTQARSTTSHSNDLIERISKAQNVSESVILSISTQQPNSNGSVVELPPKEPKSYFPEDGVIVLTDTPDLSEHSDINKRITMVDAKVDDQGVSETGLSEMADTLKHKDIQLSGILSAAGIFNEGVSNAEIKTKVEVGDFAGSISVFGPEGEAVYKWEPSGSLDRSKESTTTSLSIETNSGKRIDIGIVVSDETNIRINKGVSRSLEVTYESSEPLSKAEAEELEAILKDVDSMLTSFNHDLSVTQDNIDSLTESFIGESEQFRSLNLSFSFSAGNTFRETTVAVADGEVSQNVKEEGMGIHYSANMFEARYTQNYLGFVQGASLEYYADHELQWNEYDSVYIAGIVDKVTSPVVDSSDYFDTFFE